MEVIQGGEAREDHMTRKCDPSRLRHQFQAKAQACSCIDFAVEALPWVLTSTYRAVSLDAASIAFKARDFCL